MSSIQSIGHPLVFKVSQQGTVLEVPSHEKDEIAVRLKARALEGMQKEAIVHHGPSSTVWRMVSDEGPYLNGTDLAPFPLAFYAAGMAFSFLSEVVRHAGADGVRITALGVTQDNFYTMEGSAMRGDMLAGASPTEIAVQIRADAGDKTVLNLISRAEASSPPQTYMREQLKSTFALSHNGSALNVAHVSRSPVKLHEDPNPQFDFVEPLYESDALPDIITRLSAAEVQHGVEGGAGSSLRSEQKRGLHVHTEASVRNDGLQQAQVRLIRPIGSTFSFVGDESSRRAPPSLAYLSAGVGFCYMTQLGRYASIVRLGLNSYSIVQDSVFALGSSARDESQHARARPVDTHLFVKLDGTGDDAKRLLKMGEQTCFLHAALRTSNRTVLRARVNGNEVEAPARHDP